MDTEVVTVLKVPIKVLSFGGVTPSKIVKDPSTKPSELILIVTGNPGITKFYITFARRLFEKCKTPVWIMSHGGHEPIPSPSLKKNQDLYTVQGEVRRKEEFIATYLKGVKLRCVGHSIGTKMLLDLLKESKVASQVQSCYMLFPTIENMVTTSNGEFLTFIHKFFFWLIIIGSVFLNIIPTSLKLLSFRIYCRIASVPADNIPAISDLMDPHVLRKVFFLAHDEMITVLARDDETIKKNVDKLRFYYGTIDGWVPISYYEDLKKSVPDVKAELCEKRYLHSFVLGHSIQMADIVAEWVKNDQVSVDINKQS